MNRFSQTEARKRTHPHARTHTHASSAGLVVPHGAPIHAINRTSPVETTPVPAEQQNKLTLSGAIQMRDASSARLAETHTKGEVPCDPELCSRKDKNSPKGARCHGTAATTSPSST